MVEVLMAAAIVGGISLTTFQLIQSNFSLSSQTRRFSRVENFKNQLIGALRNNDSLNYTGTNNNITCLYKISGDCFSSVAPGSTSPLRIYSQSNQLLTNPSSPTFGFDESGAVCNTFGSNTSCKYQYVTTIKSICSGACRHPQYLVTGTLNVSGAKSGLDNATSFATFRVYIGDLTMSSEAYCGAAGGKFSSGQCQMPFGMDCPPAQRATGINPENNTVICKPIFQGAPWGCGSGQMLKGFRADGSPMCIAINCPMTFRPPCYDFPELCTDTPAPPIDASGGAGGGGGGGGCGGAGGGCGS